MTICKQTLSIPVLMHKANSFWVNFRNRGNKWPDCPETGIQAAPRRPYPGVNAIFADGHVNFCTGPEVFDEQLWNPQGNWVWDEGPGNNRDEFEEILRRLSGF